MLYRTQQTVYLKLDREQIDLLIFSVHDSGRYEKSASSSSLPAQAIAGNELETMQLRCWDLTGYLQYVGNFILLSIWLIGIERCLVNAVVVVLGEQY